MYAIAVVVGVVTILLTIWKNQREYLSLCSYRVITCTVIAGMIARIRVYIYIYTHYIIILRV